MNGLTVVGYLTLSTPSIGSDLLVDTSKDLYSRAKNLIPSGVNSPVRYYAPYPFFASKGKGGLIWDVDDRRYVDLCCAYGALLLGHRRAEVLHAVLDQMKKGTLFCTPTELEIDLSSEITHLYPSMSKVRLVNTGSEATMTAIRLARGYTRGKKIIKFEGCYHGAHDSVLVGAGSGSAHAGMSTSDGDLRDSTKNTLVVQYNDLVELDSVMRKHKDELAGVIVEPILANMGLILPEKEFLPGLRKATKEYDVPLIFDETVTGFRIGSGGAQEHFGIKPDITTLGKALGGGFAVAAVGGKEQIMDNLAPFGKVYQASTFAANPISTSAALAAIKTMRKLGKRMYTELERRCALVVSAIDDAANDSHIQHEINFIASMFQVFFTDRPVTNYKSCKRADAVKFERLFKSLLKRGVFVAPSQFEVAFLSHAHSKADLLHASNSYSESIKEMHHT
ncbi:MAG: glutamate-1-semialdehyde-2,1-aminomutase, glutamate-1-semialdehyde 2,1-aminomutase [Cenarchaeum symbiont of Oopsacas minuta]|nr:glutamate-1-semialdehyde-2,1-aminomutase, glutamate-1-semialdehyde 2,1-aminomutase [Cenarchaeum symbiont of Oopsacas minuta]